jgi:hypothetical protein
VRRRFWELLLLLGLGSSALLLGETLRSEAIVAADVRRARQALGAALRSFDAVDAEGRPFRVNGDRKRLFVFDDPLRIGAWRHSFEVAAKHGIDTYVVCVDVIERCRHLVAVPPRTRVIVYSEWKYLPSLAAVYKHRGAVILDAGSSAEQWIESPPSGEGETSEWVRLLGRTK